mmetsp:Transcript_33001/g.56094  ORF Transcript_33001/g.56094 Transcript_33001/m.56094 type:complete len:206 (+) Transcript_33001:65-682(+)
MASTATYSTDENGPPSLYPMVRPNSLQFMHQSDDENDYIRHNNNVDSSARTCDDSDAGESLGTEVMDLRPSAQALEHSYGNSSFLRNDSNSNNSTTTNGHQQRSSGSPVNGGDEMIETQMLRVASNEMLGSMAGSLNKFFKSGVRGKGKSTGGVPEHWEEAAYPHESSCRCRSSGTRARREGQRHERRQRKQSQHLLPIEPIEQR